MANITERLHKRVANKFPVMNVIIGSEGDKHKGTVQEREIDKHMVTLVIGTSNVYIIKAEPVEEEEDGKAD
jgi:hypothetical protein